MIAVGIHQVQAAVHRHHQAHGLQVILNNKNNKKNSTIGGNNSNNKLLNNKKGRCDKTLKTSVVEAEKRTNRVSIDSEVFELATRHHSARLFGNPIMLI